MSLGLHYHPNCSLEHDPLSAVHDCLFSKDKDTADFSVFWDLTSRRWVNGSRLSDKEVAVSSLKADLSKKTLKSRLSGKEIYRL